jgi:hypothetical protein
MIQSNNNNGLEKRDYLIALFITAIALSVYVRTLAPDILYGDSAEFQCLAYTLGISHSTGYPTYLFLSRLIGFLPINNPAWRISLFSAISAAITVGGVYLLARYFTRSRVGASLGCLSLGVSYTFWSQAVIAEVYTPGMAFLVVILLLLFHWFAEPEKRMISLLAGALLAGVGFGIHASVWLIAPPAIAFVIWTLYSQRASRLVWRRSVIAGVAGAVIGLLIFLVTFLISDQLNSPTSFIRTTLEPSRIFWDLKLEDFDTPFKRLKMTVISEQWGNALFPGGDYSFMNEFNAFFDRMTNLEFPPLVLIFAVIGLGIMLFQRPTVGFYFLFWYLFSLFFILNYQVGDKYVFYLPLYIPLVVAVGSGMGFVLEGVSHLLKPLPVKNSRLLYLLPVLFFLTMVIQPSAAIRWQALSDGMADFVTENYVFPVDNLDEPRYVAQRHLAGVADNAVFVMDWRALYTTAYLAHVEKGMTNTLFFEAMPYGNDGRVATSLIAVIKHHLEEGRPVFVEWKYPGLESQFRIMPAAGNLYKLSLRD